MPGAASRVGLVPFFPQGLPPCSNQSFNHTWLDGPECYLSSEGGDRSQGAETDPRGREENSRAGKVLKDVYLDRVSEGVGKNQSRDRSQERGQNSGVKKYPRGHTQGVGTELRMREIKGQGSIRG